MAAIRETFEETGLLFGSDEFGAPDAHTPGSWTDFAAQGVYPRSLGGDLRCPRDHAPRRPKRFDTRFFAIDASAVAKRIDGIIGPDPGLVDLVWVDFDEAKQLDLPTITKVIIRRSRPGSMPVLRPICPSRSTGRSAAASCARSSGAACTRRKTILP
jgi:8-oxo-dGTP pyrophosphatase MutT (NUDIX family)